jgi:hypothetical protein
MEWISSIEGQEIEVQTKQKVSLPNLLLHLLTFSHFLRHVLVATSLTSALPS